MPDKPAASEGARKPTKGEKPVGKVEHYYPKAKAAAVGLTGDLKVGDEIHIIGHGDDVRKKVTSLQMDHEPIQQAGAGDHIGVGLATKVHEGDDVMLVTGRRPVTKSATTAASKPRAAKKSRPKSSPKKSRPKKVARKPRKVRKAKAARTTRRRPAKKSAKKTTKKGKKSRKTARKAKGKKRKR